MMIDKHIPKAPGEQFYVCKNDLEVNMNTKRFELWTLCEENEVEELESSSGEITSPLRSRPVMDKWCMERNGPMSSHGSDEGPSNHHLFLGYDEQKRILSVLDGLRRVENSEHDRAELIRKIDELKDQLSRSYQLTEKPSEGLPVDKHFPEPIYSDYNSEPVPYTNNRDLDMLEFYTCVRNPQNEFVGYEDSFLPQRLMRFSYQPPPHYLMQPYQNHFPGHPMDFYWRNESFPHHPARSCLNCNKKNHQIPQKVLHPIFSTRSPNVLANNPVFGNLESYNSSHIISLTRHPRREVGSERPCHPIAGGAPFVTCCSCLELLKLPRKILVVMGMNQQKLRCGACSAIILIEFDKNGIVVSIPQVPKQDSDIGDVDYSEKLNENSPNCPNAGSMNSCSKPHVWLSDQRLNIGESDERSTFGESNEKQKSHSSSSNISEDEHNWDSMTLRTDVSYLSDLPPKEDAPMPISDSLHQKDTDNAFSDIDDKEKVILDRSPSQQNPAKDVSVATEMEVPFNEFTNSSVSQDSAEASKEEDKPRINKGNESIYARLIRKSVGDFSRSSQSVTGKASVFVNGQQIPDGVVKSARKKAGSIQPGNYWYDYQAGFWGVMGHPCLGIILPSIEEFNYPMPENCAAGNTRVFVNGRELNQKDLDLLARRGLPTTGDNYYLVDIYGRVWDEYTGEELNSLSQLAPTVLKAKRGFGMKIPRALAQ